MTKVRVLLSVLALTALAAVAEVPALASNTDVGRTEDGVAVPFHLEQTLQAVSVDPFGRCAPLLTITLVGTGVATHLGRFTEIETNCFNPVTLTFHDVKATITAGDGSKLFATAEGALIPTETPGIFEIAGSVTFVGGTGRFEGATGSAEGSGTHNLLTGQSTNILDGALILDH